MAGKNRVAVGDVAALGLTGELFPRPRPSLTTQCGARARPTIPGINETVDTVLKSIVTRADRSEGDVASVSRRRQRG
jgi:hypothetical protein